MQRASFWNVSIKSMSRLVETIKISNGRIFHLDLHNNRCRLARKELFGIEDKLDIKKFISIPADQKTGLFKCRICYSDQIHSVSIEPYSLRYIGNVKLIYDDAISYDYKFENREQLDRLFAQRDTSDEVLIVKNGYFTDSYYYNLVFQKHHQFITPRNPLLCGTQRQYLLNRSRIFEGDVTPNQLWSYDKIHFINALTPLGKLSLDIASKHIIT